MLDDLLAISFCADCCHTVAEVGMFKFLPDGRPRCLESPVAFTVN